MTDQAHDDRISRRILSSPGLRQNGRRVGVCRLRTAPVVMKARTLRRGTTNERGGAPMFTEQAAWLASITQ